MTGRTTILRRRAWAHLAAYCLDMALALTAFIVGFGLTVHNWWALLLIGIVSRWVFHTMNGALYYATERERLQEDAAAPPAREGEPS